MSDRADSISVVITLGGAWGAVEAIKALKKSNK